MDARRLLKLFTTRWWLIGIVALAGAATAYFVTTSQNAQIEETWEATAPVLILKTSAESDTEYESRLRLAENRARLAVEFELAENSDTYRVGSSAERGRLEFVAVGGDSAIAADLAEGLRAMYLTAEPTDGIVEQLTRNLDDLGVQVLALNTDRAVLVADTPIDPRIAAQLTLMTDHLSSLRQQAAALSLAIRFPELGTALDEDGNPRPSDEVRAERRIVEGTTNRLQAEYTRVATANSDAKGADGSVSLEILVIDQKIRDLESQYIDIALTVEELGGGGTSAVVSNTTETLNVTAIPTSPTRAGLLGLVLGVLLASLAVVAADRLRRPVYGTENDLALPIIALVDPARPGADPERPWYSDAVGRRRSDVQTLRAVLDGVTAGGTVTIGLSGLSVGNAAVQELAADLSTSIAASGCAVLLMDTIFDEPSVLFEYGSTGTDLADIVTGRTSSGDAQEGVKFALGDRELVIPELLSLRAGRLSADPVDTVAGRRFRELLDVAADFVEIVIVAVPHWGQPETDVLAQRLDHFVLVGRSRATTARDLGDPAAELATRHAQAVGLVLLRKRRLFRSRSADRRSRHEAVVLDSGADTASDGLIVNTPESGDSDSTEADFADSVPELTQDRGPDAAAGVWPPRWVK